MHPSELPNDPHARLSEPLRWPEEGVSRVPFRVFSDPEIYALEQRRLFHGPVWHFLCLELDIPNSFDYRTTWVGDSRLPDMGSRRIAVANCTTDPLTGQESCPFGPAPIRSH